MGTVIRLLAFISDMFTAIVLFWGSYITFIADAIIGIFVNLLSSSSIQVTLTYKHSFPFPSLDLKCPTHMCIVCEDQLLTLTSIFF